MFDKKKYNKEYCQRPEVKKHRKEYKIRNKDKLQEYAKVYRKLHKMTSHYRKLTLVNMLGGKCMRCGYDKCLAALTFHHINPEDKKVNYEPQLKSFLQQIEDGKIMLLCSNCHIELHHKDD
jgi:5-methylcytosine-specific restriction endonuclease McrA